MFDCQATRTIAGVIETLAVTLDNIYVNVAQNYNQMKEVLILE